MGRLKYLLLIIPIITGCNQQMTTLPMVAVNSELQTYVDDFIHEGKLVGKNIIIDNLVVDLKSNLNKYGANVVGVCLSKGSLGIPVILIETPYWRAANDTERHVLLFHELGHCILGRGHVETFQSFGPTSLMYPDIEDWLILMYSSNWAYYMHELFYGS